MASDLDDDIKQTKILSLKSIIAFHLGQLYELMDTGDYYKWGKKALEYRKALFAGLKPEFEELAEKRSFDFIDVILEEVITNLDDLQKILDQMKA
jgi:hypothetical protein